MAHVQFVDELVREYLVFRGFSATAKAFDNDLKTDKDKGFRVDKIVDQLLQCVYNYDLNGLRECWSNLDNKLFIRLEQHFSPAIRKLENAVLKFYLVNASENNKQDKITEFFTKLTSELLGQNEWKDWFVLPFVKNPEEHAAFAVCFTRQWQDTLIVSLHNFLAAVYQCMPQPTLACFEENLSKMTELQKETEIMRKGIANLLSREDKVPEKHGEEGLDLLLDDFYLISQEIKTNENQTKILKSIMRNIGSVPPSPKSEGRLGDQQLRTSHRMFSVKRIPQTKRSMSIDRSGHLKTRERDSSLDLGTMRSGKDVIDRREINAEKGMERNFLFLSQEEYSEHKCRITSVKINNRGNLFASADTDGNMKIWSVSPSCKTVASYNAKNSILCLDWVPNHERYIIYGTSNGVIGLYDVKELKLMWEINVENDTNRSNSAFAEGTRVWLLLWEHLPRVKLIPDKFVSTIFHETFPRKRRRIEDIICSPVDSSVVIISNGKLFLVDLKLRKVEKVLNIACEAVCAKMNHNGQLIVVGTSDGFVLLVDMRKNEVIEKWETHNGAVLQMELTSDYTLMYTLGEDSKICCKSLNHTKGKATILVIPEEVKILNPNRKIFSVDGRGKFLLTVGINSGVIYKISETGLLKSLELGGHKTMLTCVDWSFANQCATCVTASQDGKIKISTLLVDAV